MSRTLRADAQANHDRLLEAAARVFARDGADTSLKSIAAEAGVGIGTLYRRFPTREDLIEATYRSETELLSNSASSLLHELAPVDATRIWMEQFVDYMLTKRGMAEALPAILATHEELRLDSRRALAHAIAELLDAGISSNGFRADISPSDALMALGGITLISRHEHQRDLATRLISLLLDGLASRPDPAAERAETEH